MNRPASDTGWTGDRRSTIKDVAIEAQVSISTVSLVINEKGNVSDDTRERVLETARRLGYVPTGAARRLASRRTGNIGFVLREDHFTRSEPFYTRIFLGCEFEARHQNVYVLLTTIPRHYERGVHTPRFLAERNVDGLVVAGKVDLAFLAEVDERGIPVVLADFEHDPYPAVVIDNQAGGQQAVGHLLGRGHRRIGFVGADMQHPSLHARLDGYRLALGAAGLPADLALVAASDDGEPDRRTGAVLAERLLSQPAPPTAVFCANDALALGVMDHAQQQGLAIPEQLAVVGFDDVSGAEDANPALTTVRVFKEQLGELALRHLTDLIEGTPAPREPYARGHQTVRIATELIVRASS